MNRILHYQPSHSNTNSLISLDAAVADYLDVRHKLKEQEDEKKSFLDKMAAEDKDGDHHDESHLAQRKWDDIKHKPFKTQKV